MDLFKETKTKKTFINELKNGDKFKSYFKVIEINKRLKKDGNPYLVLVLQDKSGKIEGKIWEDTERVERILIPGDIYEIEAYVKEFRNSPELVINKIIKADEKSYNKEDFIEEARFDIDKKYNEMINFLKMRIKTQKLLELIDLFSEKYKEKFKNHYGAMKIHHSYRGGLLEHTYSMLIISDFIAEHYNLDKEILLIGVLFHDIGKIFEFETIDKQKITLEGGLLGHIVLGNSIFLELAIEIKDFPKDLLLKIQHLIISHHGEKEFGSPELPKTQEAYALHIIDLLDSKINIFKDKIKNDIGNGNFSDYINVLGRRILIRDE